MTEMITMTTITTMTAETTETETETETELPDFRAVPLASHIYSAQDWKVEAFNSLLSPILRFYIFEPVLVFAKKLLQRLLALPPIVHLHCIVLVFCSIF